MNLPTLRTTGAMSVLACAAWCTTGALAGEETVILESIRDTSIFNQNETSNGAGEELFVGQTGPIGGNVIQRSLLKFDLSAIPAGATIVDASLQLFVVQVSPLAGGPDAHGIHRVLADWGEAGSEAGGGQGAPAEPGDATWMMSFTPDVAWAAAGGDFVAAASAITDVGTDNGVVATWTSEVLADDVAGWLADPSSNHGWIVIGNEAVQWNARKFGARENFAPERRPMLTVTFESGGGGCTGDFDGSGVIDFADVLSILANWGPCDACPQDLDANGSVDFQDLLSVLANWDGCIE